MNCDCQREPSWKSIQTNTRRYKGETIEKLRMGKVLVTGFCGALQLNHFSNDAILCLM